MDPAAASAAIEERQDGVLPPPPPPAVLPAEVLHRVATFALPVTLSSLLFVLSQTVVLAYAGNRLGTAGQGAFAVAQSIFNVTSMSIGIGFLTCLDTLCSQAYGRNPEGRELSVILLRAIVVMLLLCIPLIALLMLVVVPTLRLAYPGEVGEGAARYFDFAPLYLVINCMAWAIQRALQAQHASHLVLVAYIISTGAAPFLAQRIVEPGKVETVALTSVAVGSLLLACLTVTALWHPASKINRLPENFSFVRDVLDGNACWALLKLGSAACVSTASDWWGFEVTLLIASRNGALVASAFGVHLNVTFALLSIVHGPANTLAVAVGNELGAAQPRRALDWFHYIGALTVAIVIINSVLLFFLGEYIFTIYTRDPVLQAELARALPIMCFFHLADGMQLMMQCLFRGAGEQHAAAKATTLAVWLVGVLGGVALGFFVPEEPIRAPLFGYSVGLATIAPFLFAVYSRWDWDALAERASNTNEICSDESKPLL